MLVREYETMRRVEDTYWWYRVLRDMSAAAIARHTPLLSEASVLDAGCGTGGTLEKMRQTSASWRLHGFDFSPHAVEFSHKRGFPEVKNGSINAIPEPDASFDAVVSLDVLCCKGVDVARSFREFARVLKPGGILVMNLPAFGVLRGRHDAAVHIARRFKAAEVRGLHEEAGLVPLSIHYWNAWLFLPILAWRHITRLRSLRETDAEAESDLSPLPAPVNSILHLAGKYESRVCSLIRPPFGTSIFSVARKPYSS